MSRKGGSWKSNFNFCVFFVLILMHKMAHKKVGFISILKEFTMNFFNSSFYKLFSSNWGTETDPDMNYHNGNSEPKGFGA